MKQFLRYILTLVVILMVTTNAWAQNPNYQGSTWYSFYDATEYKNEDKTFSVFSPTTKSLSFQWKKTGWAVAYPIYKLSVSESSDGSNYTQKYYLNSGAGKKQDTYVTATTTVSENITNLRFKHDGGSLNRFYKDIKLPLAQHILLNNGTSFGTTSLDAGNQTSLATSVNQISTNAYTIPLRSFYTTSGEITIESSNPEFHFSDGSTTKTFSLPTTNFCASAGYSGSPGDNWKNISNYQEKIYFTPSVNIKGNRSTTITISDGTKTATLTLSAPVIPTYFFKAEAIACTTYTDGTTTQSTAGGSAIATFNNGQTTYSVIADSYTTASITQTATFTATPNTAGGYVFDGWKTSPDATDYVSRDLEITYNITSSALAPLDAAQQKYYAIFVQKYNPEIKGSNEYKDVKVGATWPADFQFINTETSKPSADENQPFYFSIKHTLPANAITTGSTHPTEVIAYDPEDNTITAHNAGTAVLTFHQKPTEKYNEKIFTCTITVNKYTTSFALNFANEYYVDDEINKSTFFTNSTNSEVTVQVSDKTADNRALFTYNNDILKANGATLNADSETTTITVSQPETYKWTSYTQEENVTVKKHQTNFAWNDGESLECYVDDQTDITSLYTKASDNTLPVNFNIEVIERGYGNTDVVTLENGVLEAIGEGKVVVTASQAVDRKWTDFSTPITINVKRYNLSATLNPTTTVWNATHSNPFSVSISPANGETITDFIVGESSNSTVATYNASSKTIQTYYTSGSAAFQITRLEDRKYNKLDQTLSIAVNASTEECPLPLSTYNTSTDDLSDIITLGEAGGVNLSFTYNLNANADYDHYLTLQYSLTDNGDDFQDHADFTKVTYKSKTPKNSPTIALPEGTKRMRFKRTAHWLGSKQFTISNITVTRKQDLQATDNDGYALNTDNPLELPTVMMGSDAAHNTFHFKWSACSDIKLVCNNNKFTISTTDITTAEGNSAITVSCNTSEVGTYIGIITIYNQQQAISFPVRCIVNPRWITDVISGTTSKSMLVDGTWETDFVFPTTNATPFPTEDGAFRYSIKHTFANADQTLRKPGHQDEVISYKDGVITAHNEGTAILTIQHFETENHYPSTQFKCTITVKKHTPSFTWNSNNTPYYYGTNIPNIFSSTNSDCPYTIVSDNEAFAKVENNTLYIANLNETANITVTQEENFKWYGQQAVYPIAPVNGNKHVPFTITNANYNLLKYSTKGSVSWSDSKVSFQQGSAGFNWDDSYYDIQFEGIPDKLTFNFNANGAATGLEWFVQESSNGTNWEDIENGSSTSNSGSISVTLQSSTRYLRFCYSGNLNGYISNIKVTERFQFEANPNEINFGTNGINHGQQEEMVTFLHANAGRITEAVITGADSTYFSVTPTTIPGTGRDLYGTTTLKVTFDNKGEERFTTPYTATLTIKDNAGRQIDIPLTGIRDGKSTPVFVWNPNALPYYFNTTIANIAYSSNTDYTNCPLTFTSSNEAIAKVVDGDLIIYGIGQEVTITVSQAGNNDYEAYTEDFTFTPCERPSLEVPFRVNKSLHATSVQLGTKCKWKDDSQIMIADNLWDGFLWGDDRKRALITFAGKPDKLYFEYSSSDAATPELAQFGWEVEESSNGLEWTTAWKTGSLSASWKASGEIALKPTTQFIRFSYSGNFAGYLRNIIISSFEGHNYLRAEQGTYLSRGAKYGTQAVVDPFGVACRVSRFTVDNTNIYTRFQFVDNMQYLWETADTDEMFTDDETAANTNNLWQIPDASGKFYIQSGNDLGNKGQYVTIADNALTFTSDQGAAAIWHMETAEEHDIVLKDYMDKAAAQAAEKDFGASINTLDKVRSSIDKHDFEITEIEIPAVALAEHTGEYRDGINGTFKAYDDTISGLKPGFYRLTVKALYRISASEHAQEAKDNNLESVVAYVYANDVKYPIQSVYTSYNAGSYDTSDELYNGYYYPTQLQPSVETAFKDQHRYLNDVYVYVKADEGKTTGTLRYGIKNPSFVPGAWLAYSTVTLTHFGRKEYIFEGTATDNPTDWHTAANWNKNDVPGQYHNVVIQADAAIATPVEIYSMTIAEGKTVNITSTGGLSVGELGINNAATDGSSIIIDNLKTGAGFLRISPQYKGAMPRATVNYQTRSTLDTGANRDATWQYFGAPGANTSFTVDYITWLYLWNEQKGWQQQTGTLTFQPFAGYAITQYGKPTYALIANPINTDQTIQLTKTATNGGMDGDNLFANSFMAPIDVKNFTKEDFKGDMDMTFYIFNSGSWNQWNGQNEKDSTIGGNGSTTPGQYCAIPALSAKYLDSDITTIPPMQGVYVIANENGATIRLDYNKHIWQAGTYTGSSTDMHEPMRAPQRQAQEQMQQDDFRRLRLQVNSANSGADRMYIIQESTTTRDYDNGYDAPNQFAEGIANIYTTEPFGKMEVSCANNIDSMYIGFQAGTDEQYTLSFRSLIGDSLYLKDLSNDSIFLLTEGGKYHFTAQPLSTNDLRFQVLLHPVFNNEDTNAGITTDMEYVADTHIWHDHNQLYITNAPANSTLALYNINGQLILSHTTQHTTHTIDLYNLHQGVYILQLNNQMYKFVRQ